MIILYNKFGNEARPQRRRQSLSRVPICCHGPGLTIASVTCRMNREQRTAGSYTTAILVSPIRRNAPPCPECGAAAEESALHDGAAAALCAERKDARLCRAQGRLTQPLVGIDLVQPMAGRSRRRSLPPRRQCRSSCRCGRHRPSGRSQRRPPLRGHSRTGRQHHGIDPSAPVAEPHRGPSSSCPPRRRARRRRPPPAWQSG